MARKRRVWRKYRTRKKGGQHYWKCSKRNFGSDTKVKVIPEHVMKELSKDPKFIDKQQKLKKEITADQLFEATKRITTGERKLDEGWKKPSNK